MKFPIYNTIKMKSFVFLFGIFTFISFSFKGETDCLDQKSEDECSKILFSIYDNYIYLRSKAFDPKEIQNVMFPVTLKKNVSYVFNVCGGGKKDLLVLNLYNSENKLVASSLNTKKKNNSDEIIINFRPEAAGKYYISSSFDKKKGGSCCLIMFGMIKESI